MKNLESNFGNKSHSFWNSWKEFSETNNKQYVDIQDGNKWESFYKNLLSNKINKSVPSPPPPPENFFDNIKKFMIFPQSELSDHCKIAIEIPNMKDIRSQNNTYRWFTLNKAFKWTENSIFKFQKAFNQTEIKTLIDDFHNSLPSDNIDAIGTKLTNILNSVGKISLRRKKTDFTQKSPKGLLAKLRKNVSCGLIKNVIKLKMT